jgi:hypothetical protein
VSKPRVWSIVVHLHEDSSLTARIWVDGRLLRPDCVACTRTATLGYVEAALIDARREDKLVIRVQGKGGIRALSSQEAAQTVQWLREQLPVDECEDANREGARSGTRPIVRPSAATTSDAALDARRTKAGG